MIPNRLTKLIHKDKSHIGLSPDDLIHKGVKKTDEVLIRLIDFDAEVLKEGVPKAIEEIRGYKAKNTVTWINIDGLHSTEVMEQLCDVFELEQMVLAEVLNTDTRPKVVEYNNCLFISVKMLQSDETTGLISVENLSLVLTKSVLLSFQEKRGDVFEPVRERIRKQRKRIRNGGTDYLTFALLDIVIDNYLYVLSLMGEKIEVLEDNLLVNPNEAVINKINSYKKELNFLRRNINPAREMISSLSKMESEFMGESTNIHFNELVDNINQAGDASDSFREILSDQLNIYHTTISSKLNDIMKFLTVFSVVFIPLTFIAGIYGTNFEFVPELKYKYSYFIMWGVMIIVVIGMLIYFRRRKWL